MCWLCDHPGATDEDYLDELRAIIRRCRWAVQFVESDQRPLAYTIGLHEVGLPELLVTGVKKRLTGAALALLAGVAFAPLAAANPYPDEHFQFFRSPSGNIHCEIDFQRGSGIPDGAYCMSVKPMAHVLIRSDGSLANVCTNDPSCGSNGPQDEAVLPYGQTAALGPFTCLSEESGMTCTANGRGFKISSAGITPV